MIGHRLSPTTATPPSDGERVRRMRGVREEPAQVWMSKEVALASALILRRRGGATQSNGQRLHEDRAAPNSLTDRNKDAPERGKAAH